MRKRSGLRGDNKETKRASEGLLVISTQSLMMTMTMTMTIAMTTSMMMMVNYRDEFKMDYAHPHS